MSFQVSFLKKPFILKECSKIEKRITVFKPPKSGTNIIPNLIDKPIEGFENLNFALKFFSSLRSLSLKFDQYSPCIISNESRNNNLDDQICDDLWKGLGLLKFLQVLELDFSKYVDQFIVFHYISKVPKNNWIRISTLQCRINRPFNVVTTNPHCKFFRVN